MHGRARGATRARVGIAVLAVAAVLAPAATAHAPLFFAQRNASPTTPLLVADGTDSIAAYGRLGRATRTLHLDVKLARGAREPLEVLTPAGTEPFPSVRVEVRAPGSLWPPVRPLTEPQSFYEPFGRQSYLRTHAGRIGSAAGGSFLVRVTLPRGVSSRSVCASRPDRARSSRVAATSAARSSAFARGRVAEGQPVQRSLRDALTRGHRWLLPAAVAVVVVVGAAALAVGFEKSVSETASPAAAVPDGRDLRERPSLRPTIKAAFAAESYRRGATADLIVFDRATAVQLRLYRVGDSVGTAGARDEMRGTPVGGTRSFARLRKGKLFPSLSTRAGGAASTTPS